MNKGREPEALGFDLPDEIVPQGSGEAANRSMGLLQAVEFADPVDGKVEGVRNANLPIEILDEADGRLSANAVADVREYRRVMASPENEQRFRQARHVFT